MNENLDNSRTPSSRFDMKGIQNFEKRRREKWRKLEKVGENPKLVSFSL